MEVRHTAACRRGAEPGPYLDHRHGVPRFGLAQEPQRHPGPMKSNPDFEQLEESLWRPETRFDRHYYGSILHPDFFEFGHSGRVWTREQSITAQPGPIPIELPLPDLWVHEVTDAVVLITYVSVVRYGDATRISNRSSLWQRVGDRWLLRFHQGTPTTA